MKFFPLILHRSTLRGTLLTEWIQDPIQLRAAVKDLLEASDLSIPSKHKSKVEAALESIQ